MLLSLRNISRVYQLKGGNSFSALKDINLSFSSCGLVSIVGKSGSGKSTLLNLICRIDKPTTGEIILNGKEYSKIKSKKDHRFFNKDIGIVFQSYNLIDDNTVLDNVSLPLLLSGYSRNKAKKKVVETLSKVGIEERFLNKKVAVLSGGEKQRVALARAIINEPKILLCDEPTGALDSKNSISMMELVSQISKSTLVIMVSHNLPLLEKYADRIIEIKDGKIIYDQIRRKVNEVPIKKETNRHRNGSWIEKFALKNYKKRFKRNFVSSLALAISLTMMYLVIGFINGKDTAVKNACYQQFDFGSGTISEEVKMNSEGILTLSRSSRPDFNYLISNTKIGEKYEICLNYSAIFPSNIQFSYQQEQIDDLIFTPIYSFTTPYVNPKMITKGSLPNGDSLFEIVVNQLAYDSLKTFMGKDPLYETFNMYHSIETIYVNELGEYISDLFIYDFNARVTGVVKELNYLSSPKIYYSYSALQEYLSNLVLINLSTYYEQEITWYDRVYEADNNSSFSAYSFLLFLKDYHFGDVVYSENFFPSELTFTSQSYMVAKSLLDFLEVAEYAVLLFLGITLIGSIIILSIMSFASYSEDHKASAILSSLGAKNSEIQEIYLNESLLSGILAFFLSTGFAFLSSIGINLLISKYIELENVIVIPFLSFLGIKFLLPLGIFIFIVLIVCISTVIPITFSKKNSIKDELQSI